MNKFITTIFVVTCLVALSHCIPLEDKPVVSGVKDEINPVAVSASELQEGEDLVGEENVVREKRQCKYLSNYCYKRMQLW